MFKNKIVVVTGASSGIGAETALLFAKNGAKVVITYKNNKIGAQKVASQIKEFSDVLIIQADLTNDLEAKKVIDKTNQELGGLDILVNNAGRYIEGDEWDGDSKTWLRSIKQNLISAMSVSKYAIQIFKKQKSGVIVNIASRFSAQGQFDALTYSASKAGIVNITQSYARLLAPFGRANSVSPGAVNTGYWLNAPKEEIKETIENVALGKLIETKDVAEMIVFLSSDKALNITGQNIFVDGGFNLN